MTNVPEGADDLAGGAIAPLQERIIQGQLDEETQRRRWKTGVMVGSVIGIVAFYAALGIFVFCIDGYKIQPFSYNLIIGILAAVPTLLAVNLFKLVSRPSNAKDSDDFERSPWFSLIKELIDAIKAR